MEITIFVGSKRRDQFSNDALASRTGFLSRIFRDISWKEIVQDSNLQAIPIAMQLFSDQEYESTFHGNNCLSNSSNSIFVL